MTWEEAFGQRQFTTAERTKTAYKQITYNIRKSVNEVLDIRANIK